MHLKTMHYRTIFSFEPVVTTNHLFDFSTTEVLIFLDDYTYDCYMNHWKASETKIHIEVSSDPIKLVYSHVTVFKETIHAHIFMNEDSNEPILHEIQVLLILKERSPLIDISLPIFKKQVFESIKNFIDESNAESCSFLFVSQNNNANPLKPTSDKTKIDFTRILVILMILCDRNRIYHQKLPVLEENIILNEKSLYPEDKINKNSKLNFNLNIKVEFAKKDDNEYQMVLLNKSQLKSQIETDVNKLLIILNFFGFEKNYILMSERIALSVLKDRRIPKGSANMPAIIHQLMKSQTENEILELRASYKIPEFQEKGEILEFKPYDREGWTVFEFFSGIGGMRLGLPDVIRGFPINKIEAFELSSVSNSVYKHNFENSSKGVKLNNVKISILHEITIEGLKVETIDGKSDIWTLSPPCQPYTCTRGALKKDSQDPRAGPLSHLMILLLKMRKKPKFIFLENVKDFWQSEMQQLWQKVLTHCGYTNRHFSICPTQLKVPNSRRRYYCLSELQNPQNSYKTQLEVELEDTIACLEPKTLIPTIGEYLTTKFSTDLNPNPELYLTQEQLTAPWSSSLISVIGPFCRESFCFTGAYGRILTRATGSVFYPFANGPLKDHHFSVDLHDSDLVGKIRFFSGEELLMLFGFPDGFLFPPMSEKQKWSLIGNSVNVTVVKKLMLELFS